LTQALEILQVPPRLPPPCFTGPSTPLHRPCHTLPHPLARVAAGAQCRTTVPLSGSSTAGPSGRCTDVLPHQSSLGRRPDPRRTPRIPRRRAPGVPGLLPGPLDRARAGHGDDPPGGPRAPDDEAPERDLARAPGVHRLRRVGAPVGVADGG